MGSLAEIRPLVSVGHAHDTRDRAAIGGILGANFYYVLSDIRQRLTEAGQGEDEDRDNGENEHGCLSRACNSRRR